MVDSVNNVQQNNTGLYTGLGVAAGAALGGSYGKFMTTPHMKGDEIADTFVKTVKEAEVAETKSANKTLVEELGKVKDGGKLDGISDAVKKEIQGSISADDFGKKTEAELKTLAGDLLDSKIQAEGAKDAAELITKLDAKADASSVDALLNKKQVLGAIADDADAVALKKAVTDNAEKLGLKEVKDADGKVTKTVEQAVDDFIGNKSAKTLKEEANTAFDAVKNPIKELFDGKKLKALEDSADASTKSLYATVKKTISGLQNKAALKWGGIAAAALGVIGLATGMASKKAPEVAPEQQTLSTQA